MHNVMSEKELKEGQKTIVAFVTGLLVGGLLVWIFSIDTNKAEAPQNAQDTTTAADTAAATEVTDTQATGVAANLPVGNGAVQVADQQAGSSVTLDGVTFPTEEGWIGVRQYNNGTMSYILGVIQYSKSANRIPHEIPLLSPTVAGQQYAVVFFSQDSNRAFNLDGDVQLDTPLATFTAQ